MEILTRENFYQLRNISPSLQTLALSQFFEKKTVEYIFDEAKMLIDEDHIFKMLVRRLPIVNR